MDDERSGDLLARWRAGDQRAAEELFRRYAGRLIALARRRLSAKIKQRVDPEDVVQSVYRSFFTDTREGRYDLQRAGDLWRLLVTITLHKLNDQKKRHRAGKRAVERETGFGSEDSLLGLHAHVNSHEPSPIEAVALAEQLEGVMAQLEPVPRRMFEMRLQGHNLEEIAVALECSQRTVIRVLERIKQQLDQGQI